MSDSFFDQQQSDVPGVPGGPIDVRDVYKEGCTLRWQEPDDDGGSPIQHYVVEKQENDGRWIPVSNRLHASNFAVVVRRVAGHHVESHKTDTWS